MLEITPRQILQGPMADILEQRQARNPILPTLSATDRPQQDPIRTIVARCVAHGLAHDRTAVFGDAPRSLVSLPAYPMQREEFHLGFTSEALNAYGRLVESVPLHPLLGSRFAAGSPEWRCCLLDPVLVPYLQDHRVDGTIVVPASALIDMALSVGSELFGPGPIELDEFDILKALTFADDETRELSTRYSSQADTIEIWSRRRLAGNEWLLHARGTVRRVEPSAVPPKDLPVPADPIANVADDIYAEAEGGSRVRAAVPGRPVLPAQRYGLPQRASATGRRSGRLCQSPRAASRVARCGVPHALPRPSSARR